MIVGFHRSVGRPRPADPERTAVAVLVGTVQSVMPGVEQPALVNLYVAAKSKPLLLLMGPEKGGKIAVMRGLAQVLTGGETLHAQFMPGHAWWAGQSGNVALYTNAQTRLNTAKLLALLEEAELPENRERVLLGCLTRISPAELLTFYSDTAFQLKHGELMRLQAAHFTEPVPYPRNLLLAGTLDGRLVLDPDPDMLSMTSVVDWPGGGDLTVAGGAQEQLPATTSHYGREFLSSMVRTEAEARLKLSRVLHRSVAALQPLTRLEEVLHHHVGDAWPTLRSELLVYLANAFSRAGVGLFAERAIANLEVALDWAVTTVVVPRLRGPLWRAHGLRIALRDVSANRWPTTSLALEALPVSG